jgi:hypothetical protein
VLWAWSSLLSSARPVRTECSDNSREIPRRSASPIVSPMTAPASAGVMPDEPVQHPVHLMGDPEEDQVGVPGAAADFDTFRELVENGVTDGGGKISHRDQLRQAGSCVPRQMLGKVAVADAERGRTRTHRRKRRGGPSARCLGR